MSFVRNESCFAMRKPIRNLFRQPNGESTIFYSMPKSHWCLNIFDRESPGLRINLCVDHHPFCRVAPGASLPLKNRLESCVVAQAGCVTATKQQHFLKKRKKAKRRGREG